MSLSELNGVKICPLFGASNFSLRTREVCLDNIPNTNKRNEPRPRHTECRAASPSLPRRTDVVQHVPQPMCPGAGSPSRTGVALRAIRRKLRSPRQDATIHEGEALMAISLHSGFVPVCLQLLGGLKTVLQKAEEHATAQKGDTATVLNLRLYPDMFTLEHQVRQVCNHALGAGHVAGVTLPSLP